MIVENFLELVDIDDIQHTEEYVNMIDISVDVDQSFLLSNGLVSHNSASAAFRKYRDANTMGSFALKGKFINVSEITTRKLTDNKEAVNLMAAMGISIGTEVNLKDLRYGRMLIYTDADCLEENTMVVTKNGNKKISDVDYTDEMLTHTGEYKKINNIIGKEISSYIKISVNGDEIVCSEDHKLIVVRNGEVEEIKAKDLKYDDQFLIEK